jgi:hypothetical protein
LKPAIGRPGIGGKTARSATALQPIRATSYLRYKPAQLGFPGSEFSVATKRDGCLRSDSTNFRRSLIPHVQAIDLDDPEIAEQVAAVGARASPRLIEFTVQIRELIQAAVPALRRDERVTSLLEASARENVDTMMRLLCHGIRADGTDAPSAALEYGRRLEQRDVAVGALIRAHRIGQARFLCRCLALAGNYLSTVRRTSASEDHLHRWIFS